MISHLSNLECVALALGISGLLMLAMSLALDLTIWAIKPIDAVREVSVEISEKLVWAAIWLMLAWLALG